MVDLAILFVSSLQFSSVCYFFIFLDIVAQYGKKFSILLGAYHIHYQFYKALTMDCILAQLKSDLTKRNLVFLDSR